MKMYRYITIVFLVLAALAAGFFMHRPAPRLTHEPELAAGAAVTQPQQEPSVSILAFGDLMLDRAVRTTILNHGADYPFVSIEQFLNGHDIVVANAEGPFTNNTSVATADRLQFTFDPGELPTLHNLGFTLLSQANNHAFNFGAAGLRESQANIRASGIGTFGDPQNDDPGPSLQIIHGQTVAFIGYHQFLGTDTKVLEAIREAKTLGAFTILYPHWGVEYSTTTSAFQRAEAHAFIDAGADAVLGAHPHVIEPIEIYNGKAIFYSMGNFIFDQSNSGPTSEGLAIEITLTPSQATYTIDPLDIAHAQASLMPDPERTTILQTLAHTATLATTSESLRSGIADGVFTLDR